VRLTAALEYEHGVHDVGQVDRLMAWIGCTLGWRSMDSRNESEQVFEQYLDLNGYQGKWSYEPSLPGKTKRPDYLLDLSDKKHLFEVKELRAKSNQRTDAAHTNPYAGLRSEISEGRKKFKEFKDCSCSLVVYRMGDRNTILEPQFVLAAMLGNLGIGADLGSAGQPVKASMRNEFLTGGKMIDQKHKRRQNTTINAVVVLEKLLDNRNVQRAMNEQMRRQGRAFTEPEKVGVRLKLHEEHSVETVPRVITVENPFARIPLPEDLFRGPFDERWRWMEKQNGKIRRVFAGDSLRELEALDGDNPWDRLP